MGNLDTVVLLKKIFRRRTQIRISVRFSVREVFYHPEKPVLGNVTVCEYVAVYEKYCNATCASGYAILVEILIGTAENDHIMRRANSQ